MIAECVISIAFSRGGTTLCRSGRLEWDGIQFWTTSVTVTLNLRPEVEAGLIAQAEAHGVTLEEYLLSMVEGAALSSSPAISSTGRKGMPAREAAVRRMLEFGDRYHLSLGEPVTRTLLHEGHRF